MTAVHPSIRASIKFAPSLRWMGASPRLTSACIRSTNLRLAFRHSRSTDPEKERERGRERGEGKGKRERGREAEERLRHVRRWLVKVSDTVIYFIAREIIIKYRARARALLLRRDEESRATFGARASANKNVIYFAHELTILINLLVPRNAPASAPADVIRHVHLSL